MNAGFFLNVVACFGHSPHGLVPGSGIVVVKSHGFQVRLEGVGGFESVVVGHLVEQMVGHMCRSDAVVEKVKDSVRTIDGRQGTSDPGPFSFSVLGDGGIVVLEPRVEDQSGVYEEVRVPVPEDDGQGAELGRQHQVSQDSQLQ